MSKSNPMELVDRYLQAVRFWLPKSLRHDGLIAELGEDLRSQIEDKEAELGRPLEESEVSDILKRCGAPMVVAGSLRPEQHLIGPALFPIYMFVLKMVLFWILVPVFVFILVPVNVANDGANWAEAVASTLGQLWSGLFIAAGIITLVFAIVERTQAQVAAACKWDPLKLPPVRKQERKTTVAQTVCQLVFGFFGIIWVLLLPQYPVLILGPAAAFLKAAPIVHTLYVPILLLGVFGLLRAGITLGRPEWTWFPQVAELVQMVLSLVLLNFILNAAGHAPNGDWHPFLMLSDAAKNSAQAIKVAAIVNVSILISLAGAWLGLSIALVIHVWLFLVYLRKRVSGVGNSASLQMQ
jgi:hypothetical protein